jgi:hypothetical protein
MAGRSRTAESSSKNDCETDSEPGRYSATATQVNRPDTTRTHFVSNVDGWSSSIGDICDIWQLHETRRYVIDDCFRSLVGSLVYISGSTINFIFDGSTAHRLRLFPSVLIAAACATLHHRQYDNITDTLAILRWLRLPERVDYKLAVLAYDSLQGQPPSYLFGLQRVADLPDRHSLRSSASGRLEVPVH